MSQIPKRYKVYCVTEGEWITGDVTTVEPTTCPTDAGHTIQRVKIAEDPAVGYEPILYFDPADNKLKRNDGSSIMNIPSKNNKVLYVSNTEVTSADYTSIKDAIAVSSAETLIYVYPGTYIEQNPLIIPSQVSVVAMAGPEATLIMPVNNDQPIFNMGIRTRLKGFKIYGAYASGGKAIVYDGSGSPGYYATVEECLIYDCNIGIEAKNAPNILLLFRNLIANTGATFGAMSKSLYCHSGCLVKINVMNIVGHPLYKTTIGVHIDGTGSTCSFLYLGTQYCVHGAVIDNDGAYNFEDILLENNDVGICINSGTESKLSGASFDIYNSATADVEINATNAVIFIESGHVDVSKFINPNNVKVIGSFFVDDEIFKKRYITRMGPMQFGTIQHPGKISIGEGRFLDGNISMLTNTNLEVGTWTDRGEEGKSPDGSTFNMFESTTVGECLYIGHDNLFSGLRVNVDTAGSLSDIEDIYYELWDGSSWVRFKTMSVDSTEPLYSRGQHFCTTATTQNIRFGIHTNTTWALKTLNGLNKYWIRCRVVNTLSSIAVIEQIKLVPNNIKFSDKGYTEYFGDARVINQLPWNITNTLSSTTSPTDQDLFVSDNLNIDRIINSFSSTVVNKIGFNSYLPVELDTSLPLKVVFSFIGTSDTSGDVKWMIRWGTTKTNDNVYRDVSTAPTTGDNEQSLTFITNISSSSSDTQLTETQKLDISNLMPRPSDGNISILWITLERMGDDVEDTYPGNVCLIQMTTYYIKWCEGGYITEY